MNRLTLMMDPLTVVAVVVSSVSGTSSDQKKKMTMRRDSSSVSKSWSGGSGRSRRVT